jgi:2-polyprenyl-6-hydroxyphenyl methylase / 3-demethylubiquinone-9 3-methyltransferase
MPVDNEIYDRLAGSWWDEDEFIYLLRSALNPVRLAYFEDVLARELGDGAGGRTALDIGCGGGFMTEEFARSGYRVTGIDPSAPTIEAARAHAAAAGLEIAYEVGAGEQLPFDDRSFEVVYCCDTLEHVDDLERVIGEASRVLADGGVFLYDTINRTLRSNLLYIKVAQEWRWTRFMPPDLHDRQMFIKPRELRERMARHGLESRDLAGISPANPATLIGALWKVKRGRISYREFGERMKMRKSRDTSASYLGYGVKTAPRARVPA